MKTKKYESGQALVFIVAAIIGLVAMTGLTVDGSLAYVDRQNAQSSADSAALGAALAKIRGQNVTTKALGIAAVNGYINDTVHDTITVTNPITSATTDCKGQAINSTYQNADYIQVKIVTNVNTYFAPIVGIRQTHNCVEAIARAQTGVSGSFGGGNGIIALKQTGTAISFTGSGNVSETGGIASNSGFSSTGSGDFNVSGGLQVSGSYSNTGSGDWTVGGATFVNSLSKTGSQNFTTTGPVFVNGNFSQTGSGDFAGTALSVVGTYSNTGSGTVTPAKTTASSVTPPVMADPLATVLNPPANPGGTCQTISYTGSTAHTLNPGCYVSISQTGSGNLTLNPGLYYITGSNGISMTGSGNLVASGVLIYLQTGNFSGTGSGNVTLTPMTSGDYTGLSVYMDRANTRTFSMTGSGTSTISGTMYAPSSAVTITGSGGIAVVDSQIVCSTITLTGSGGLGLQYNASHNYQVPSQAAIELTK